ncbi:MAG: hypothetical protein ACE1Z0_03355, partial [Acidimicrobiia bacterium]
YPSARRQRRAASRISVRVSLSVNISLRSVVRSIDRPRRNLGDDPKTVNPHIEVAVVQGARGQLVESREKGGAG